MFPESLAYIERTEWANVGSITAALAGTDLDKDNRATATAEALSATKIALLELHQNTVALEFRFRADGADGTVDTLDLFTSAKVDHYRRIATLALTSGKQVYSGSILFKDTLVESNNDWISTVEDVSNDDDYFATYVLNTHGYDRFLFAATTLNSTTVYVDWRRM